MRIQNNITAMNTHRMYTINNDNVAKSAEKLSSGYRINRAGDDAAGLAISEKMRSQIRGLNMATKNSQDAISLVQTAEGALQETHSMLQRMNELAVQAATGTNEDFDRNALAKEFEQLKREINDVAEQTNFNNMKILDGSLSYEGYVRSAATAGVTQTVETTSNAASSGVTFEMKEAVHTATATQAKLEDITLGLGTLDQTSDYKLEVFVDGKKMQLTDATGKEVNGSSSTATTATTGLTGWADLRFTTEDGRSFKIAGAATADKITITEIDAAGNAVNSDLDWDKMQLSVKVSAKAKGDSEYTDKATVTKADATKVINGVSASTTAAAEAKLTIDPSKIKDGDTITVGDKTYALYTTTRSEGGVNYGKDAEGNEVKEGAAGGNVINVMWNGKTEGADLVKNLAAAMTANPPTGSTQGADTISVSSSGNTITVKATVEAPAGATGDNANWEDAQESIQNAANATKYITPEYKSTGTTDSTKTTIEFDIAKMKDGDTFTINLGGKKISVAAFSSTDDRKSFMQKVEDAAKAAGIGEVKGNALIIHDKPVDSIDLKWNEDLNKETNAIRIQVGANEHEQLSVSIDSMNTKGLGLDDSALIIPGASTSDNQDAAGKAITAVKAAINKVSDQRATLGAMQNRLEHKIANLKVSSENLSAAESRIRDVDMASEMTNFTKNNILSQAATAMLAQANALPQNVLSLLG